ncbi:hypothetical protein [Paracoccus sp. IB05]|uniref:hypothetical protein n=1 Tax=Paracoccus sp. IB05 TaxID=2779367 RepID=UPI0018E7970E|nr:hypothetical protein [Paracoccus sp. IB05]MBJ2150321.1 hypothetical protein [Paracoccus sp. IB05]
MTTRYAALVAVTVILCPPGMADATQIDDPRPATGFSWMVNGAQAGSAEIRQQRAKEALIRAKALNSGASWVCSPAGFGKASRCHRG